MDILDFKTNPLWLNSLKEKGDLTSLFSTIGKLLFVCQKFETNCKLIAKHIQIMTTDDLFSNTNSYNTFLNKIKTSTLNNNIKLVDKLTLIGDPIEILNAARKSRNFIAHEIYIGLENKLGTIADQLNLESEIKLHGQIIANGEFVAAWLCGLLLRGSLPNLTQADQTIKWLFTSGNKEGTE